MLPPAAVRIGSERPIRAHQGEQPACTNARTIGGSVRVELMLRGKHGQAAPAPAAAGSCYFGAWRPRLCLTVSPPLRCGGLARAAAWFPVLIVAMAAHATATRTLCRCGGPGPDALAVRLRSAVFCARGSTPTVRRQCVRSHVAGHLTVWSGTRPLLAAPLAWACLSHFLGGRGDDGAPCAAALAGQQPLGQQLPGSCFAASCRCSGTSAPPRAGSLLLQQLPSSCPAAAVCSWLASWAPWFLLQTALCTRLTLPRFLGPFPRADCSYCIFLVSVRGSWRCRQAAILGRNGCVCVCARWPRWHPAAAHLPRLATYPAFPLAFFRRCAVVPSACRLLQILGTPTEWHVQIGGLLIDRFHCLDLFGSSRLPCTPPFRKGPSCTPHLYRNGLPWPPASSTRGCHALLLQGKTPLA